VGVESRREHPCLPKNTQKHQSTCLPVCTNRLSARIFSFALIACLLALIVCLIALITTACTNILSSLH
jgi:hypothetical protein